MKIKLISSLVCLSLSLPAFAMSAPSTESNNNGWWAPSRVSMGLSGGYTRVDGGYSNDGDVMQGRFTLGLHTADYQSLAFGLEAGLQSGNDMRLTASNSLIVAAGGLPIQATLKPFVDLLVTMKGQFSSNSPVYGMVKAGVAYRQLQLNDRTSTTDSLRQFNGELQLGLGFNMTEHTSLMAYYQGIYSGSDAGASLNSVGDVTISRIPTEQAGFIGLEYTL